MIQSKLLKKLSAACVAGAAAGAGGGAVGPEILPPPAAQIKSTKPNVLFILTDQWRAQALSCAGDPNIQTPNIDALATAGVRFAHCIANSPICTPFRAMLMSGRFPTDTGVNVNNILLPPSEYCLAEAFGDAGYSTGYIGKWHLDGEDKPGYVEHRQGWQFWAGFNRGHDYFNGVYFLEDDTPISNPPGSFEPDHQTDMAIDYIEGHAADTDPWFLTVAFGGPHTPYTAPQSYMDQFDPNTFQLRPNVSGDLAQARADLHGYYAHAKNLDDNIGRLVQTLTDNGLTDDTLVIFTSDHGDMHFSQGEIHKGKPWEESIGVPFIARWPQDIPAGRTVDALLGTIDIYPTLCSLCDVAIPAGKRGGDYAHLLRDEPGPEAGSVFLMIEDFWNTDLWRGVRTPQYTYAWAGDVNGAPWVLYDNIADPYQMTNLIDDPGMQSVEDELHDLLLRWLCEVGDPLLIQPVRSDFDGDGDADLADFAAFAQCFNGEGQPPAHALCDGTDLDGDEDVDFADFTTFAGCLLGPGWPPQCPCIGVPE